MRKEGAETLQSIRSMKKIYCKMYHIDGYFKNVKAALKTGGYSIFAEFLKICAPKCAGLTLHRYSVEELSEKLGSSFKLISHFEYTYINSNGDPRQYVYILYKKEN